MKATPAIFAAIILVLTLVAARQGMCGDGNFQPSCPLFSVALTIYGLAAVLIITMLGTAGAFVLRRNPPVILKSASLLTLLALGVLVGPVLAVGNKHAGAIVLMVAFPIVFILFLLASICFLLWFSNAIGGWLARRAVPGGLSPNG